MKTRIKKILVRNISILTFCFLLAACNFMRENKAKSVVTDTDTVVEPQKLPKTEQEVEPNQNSLFDTEYGDLTEEVEFFSGFEDFGGTVISDKDNRSRSLGHVKKENLHIIVLEKINEGSKPTRAILDTLHFISSSENYYTDLLECEDVNDSSRKLIFGFYYYEEGKESFDKIGFAWQVDLKSDKLETIDTSGIQCSNIGYGL